MFGKCMMGYEYFIYIIDMFLDLQYEVYVRNFERIFLAFAYP
jgi:hypothetical protein